jgi:hypothetical protein
MLATRAEDAQQTAVCAPDNEGSRGDVIEDGHAQRLAPVLVDARHGCRPA